MFESKKYIPISRNTIYFSGPSVIQLWYLIVIVRHKLCSKYKSLMISFYDSDHV